MWNVFLLDHRSFDLFFLVDPIASLTRTCRSPSDLITSDLLPDFERKKRGKRGLFLDGMIDDLGDLVDLLEQLFFGKAHRNDLGPIARIFRVPCANALEPAVSGGTTDVRRKRLVLKGRKEDSTDPISAQISPVFGSLLLYHRAWQLWMLIED